MLDGDRIYTVDASGASCSSGLELWSGPDIELPSLPDSVAMDFHTDVSGGWFVQTNTYADGVPGIRVLSVGGSLMANVSPRVATGSLADYESASTFQSFTEVVCAPAWSGPDGLVGFAHSASLSLPGVARVSSRGLWKLGGTDESPLPVVGESISSYSFLRPLISPDGCLFFLRKNAKTGVDSFWWAEFNEQRFGQVLDSAHFLDMADCLSVGEIHIDSISGSQVAVRTKRKLTSGVSRNTDTKILDVSPSTQARERLREGDPLSADLALGEISPYLSFVDGKCSSLVGLVGTHVSTADNQAVLMDRNIVLRKGSLAPGLGRAGVAVLDAAFRTFLSAAHFRDTSIVRATAGLPTASAAYEGLWMLRNDETSLLIQRGSIAPATSNGTTIKRIVQYGLTSEQDVVLFVELTGLGVSRGNDQIVYLSRAGESGVRTFEVICREGDRLPGGKKIGTILKLDCAIAPGGSKSRYGILCSLALEAEVTSTKDNLAWLQGDFSVGDDRQSALRAPRVSLVKGSGCHGNGPGYESVVSISFPAGLTDASGVQNSGLADVIDPVEGGAVGVIKFPNGRSVISSIR